MLNLAVLLEDSAWRHRVDPLEPSRFHLVISQYWLFGRQRGGQPAP
jgi:hypothetical protein